MAVIFKKYDFMNNWATDCRFNLIGKFSNTMPKMELLRKSFITQTQLSGGVKIAHSILGMYILILTMNWITSLYGPRSKLGPPPSNLKRKLPLYQHGYPYQGYHEIFIRSISSLPSCLLLVRFFTLTMHLPRKQGEVWPGGKWKAIDYDSIQDYCTYCKHQGHMVHVCTIKQRDEDYKKERRWKQTRRVIQKENKGKPTNLQDGVTKGRDFTHVLHEGEYTDHLRDYRGLATPQNRKTHAQN
ncbi:hypothetical protein H5410_027622 [Solanum commersonii]|uniref:Uncharacterized protein n=1 Tax=Solanum commersonii TaxID=4109 RepID=A0A9J5Z0E2_SOLCO|nr:hypothetical protein H5410_027622 [Solanum commersonii]